MMLIMKLIKSIKFRIMYETKGVYNINNRTNVTNGGTSTDFSRFGGEQNSVIETNKYQIMQLYLNCKFDHVSNDIYNNQTLTGLFSNIFIRINEASNNATIIIWSNLQ